MHSDPTTMFRLDDKVVLVTGASSGLGARFARVGDAVEGQAKLGVVVVAANGG